MDAGVLALVQVVENVPVVAACAFALQVVEGADAAEGGGTRALVALIGSLGLRVGEFRPIAAISHGHLQCGS